MTASAQTATSTSGESPRDPHRTRARYFADLRPPGHARFDRDAVELARPIDGSASARGEAPPSVAFPTPPAIKTDPRPNVAARRSALMV
jgi:hypothetical protein